MGLKIKEKKWELEPTVDSRQQAIIAEELDIHPAIARILINRGLTTPQQCREFFNCSLEGLDNPFALKGMPRAVDRIQQALERHEKISIYGDYDVDGITSIALLVLGLRQLGATVSYYVPNRLEEGYGISEQGIQEVVNGGTQLIISVDCGITAVKELALAREKGLDIIVTDHHEPGSELPQALAILNPKQPACDYPFKELAGVGIAFKLLHGIYIKKGLPAEEVFKFLDLVALGTIADIVPLTGENRILVRHGLARMEKSENPGIKALLHLVGLTGKKLSTGQVVFLLAPRINAGGRLGDAEKGIRLFITDDQEEAGRTASRLEVENRKRKDIDALTLREADEMLVLDPAFKHRNSIVLSSDSWHVGVIGIVASRLVEKYYLPTVLISFEDNSLGRGSARSIPSFDIFSAFCQCDDLLESFGGHKYAAGLCIRRELVNEFAERFDQLVNHTLTSEDLLPKLTLDVDLPLDDIDSQFVQCLKQFAPFGPQNSRPVFFSRGTQVVGEPQIVGTNHLKFKVRQGRKVYDAIGFDMGNLLYRLEVGKSNLDIAYTIEENEWNGQVRIQLRIKGIK